MPELGRYYTNKSAIEVGIDEAGRGPLIGRVYVGAVILDPEIENLHPFLNDSKKITRKRREVVREWIEENASQFAVTYSDEKTIDKINILKATHKAMHEAIDELGTTKNIIVEDSPTGILSGKESDNFVIAVDRGMFTEDQLSKADLIVNELDPINIRSILQTL